MGFVSTVSGHIVVDSADPLDRAMEVIARQPRLCDDEWPYLPREAFAASPVEYKNERVIHFGFTAKEIEHEWNEWLARFEVLLERIHQEGLVRSAVVLLHPGVMHSPFNSGRYLYLWTVRYVEPRSSERTLAFVETPGWDVLSPGWRSRFAHEHE